MTITPYTIRPGELDQYHQKILRQGLTNQKFPEHEFSQMTQEMREHLSRDRCLPAGAGQASPSAPSTAMKILTSLCRIIDKSQLPRGPGRAVAGLSHHGTQTPKGNTQDIHPALRTSPVLKLARSTLLTELNQGQTRSTLLAEGKPRPPQGSTEGNSAQHHDSIATDERDTVIDLISNPNPGRGPPHILTSRNVGSQRHGWSKHNPAAPDDDINVWKVADLTAAMKSESDLSWEPCTQYSESPSEAIPPFFDDDDGETTACGKRRESTIHGVGEDSVIHNASEDSVVQNAEENPAIHSTDESSVIRSDKESLIGGDEHEAVLASHEEVYPEDVSCREGELADCADAGEGTLKAGEGGEMDDGWDTSSEFSFASTLHPSSSISVPGSEYGSEPEDEIDAHDGPKPGVGGSGGRPGILRRTKRRIPQLSRPLDPPDLLFSGPNLPPSPSPPRIGFASYPPLSRSAYRGRRNHCACGARGCDQRVETATSTPYFPYEVSNAPQGRQGEARRNSLKSKYFT